MCPILLCNHMWPGQGGWGLGFGYGYGYGGYGLIEGSCPKSGYVYVQQLLYEFMTFGISMAKGHELLQQPFNYYTPIQTDLSSSVPQLFLC